MDNWNVHHLSEMFETWGLWGHAAGALLVYIQTLVPVLPFLVVAGANVLIFGFWLGFIVNYVMTVLGAVTAFWIARHYGGGWLHRKLAKYSYLNAFSSKLKRHGFFYMTLSRFIPMIPSFVINYGAALMKVKPRHFVLGTIAGNLPMIFLESLVGHDLLYFQHNKGRLMLLGAIFVILFLIGRAAKKKWLQTR
ncbi:TVP38/TMEM64 family protein [Paenibacillus xerothermodurans]|uniref:TVP38/TMEM64 family membrane protein n=1 Tax=Paenibacillus xerothermodurans TaxID=1977292 RepID=A0A2W1NFU3_PAEXE|nr:TVP38/TMEM64 family protein [Paenibacillus xerothermodurans]PZE22550.1 TVP38/TMEM64 family protein [Paenibacillus xerothermodurans]